METTALVMLAYLILTGRSGAPVDSELIARFDQDDPPEVPFHPEERVLWRNHDQSVVFFGWQAFVEVAGIGSHWAIDERGLIAFTGHCWPQATGWVHGTSQSWAAQLRTYLGDFPDPLAARETLFGQFTVISLPAAGPGWIVPDWGGVDQFFVAEQRSGTALSNRAGLCAQTLARGGATPQRSLTAAGWLISEGWMLDEESSYRDVERPRAGSVAIIEPGKRVGIFEPARSYLYPPVPEAPSPSYEELLDEAECNLRQTIRAIAKLPLDDRVLTLSGGKDSRTLLALMLSEGVEKRFQFMTIGSPERADAIAAGAIAKRYRLDWSLVDLSERAPEIELENALFHTGLVEGLTSAWGAFEQPKFTPGLTATGNAGEGLRWMYVASSAIGARTIDDVVMALRKTRPIDPLGILRPEVRAYYETFLVNWVRREVEQGVPLVSLPALYMHEPLLHSRIGPETTWHPRLRINAYLTPPCMRANHRLSVDRRPDPRFHFDLQRRCAPELSKMPFAGDTWPEAAIAHVPDAEHYRHIEPVIARNADGRTWRVKRYADYLPHIEPILLDRENPVQQLLDYDRLVDRLANGGANAGRTRLIWGAFTAAAWMGRHEPNAKLERNKPSDADWSSRAAGPVPATRP